MHCNLLHAMDAWSYVSCCFWSFVILLHFSTYYLLLHVCSYYAFKSRHTVMCQRPRKQKKTSGTQVYYLLVPQSCQIQPFVSPKLLSQFLPNLYIFCLTYTLLHISNLKEIASAVLEIFVPKNCPIFFTFFFFFTQNYRYI